MDLDVLKKSDIFLEFASMSMFVQFGADPDDSTGLLVENAESAIVWPSQR